MAVASTLRGIITADASGVEKAVNDAEQEIDGLGDAARSNADQMQSAGKRMTMGLSAPLAAMGGMAVRQSASFDEAMAQSISVMGDVSDAMREDLEQTAREVAKATEHSHEQSASALYYLSSAGLDAAETMEALPAVADFASAGQMKLSEATSVATTVMRSYGYEASEMTDVTDSLAQTVSSHNTTMEQMSTAMSQVAPVASSLGISLDETSAAIGTMSDNGVQGEKAGTALRNVLSQLSDEGSTVSKQLESMGVATRDSEGNVRSLTSILREMEAAGIDAGQASSIFGMEAGPAMAALMSEGSDALENYTENIRDSEGASGDMAETQRDTLNKELATTRSRLNDAAITIGADLLPMVSTLAGYAGTAADKFAGLSDTQQKVVLAIGGIVTVAGLLIWMLGTLFTSASAVAAGFGTMTAAAGTLTGALTGGVIPAALATQVALGPVTLPLYAIVAAVAAVGAAAYGLYRVWTDNLWGIRDTATNALDTVKSWFEAAPDWVLALLGPIGWLYKAWDENLFGIQDVVGRVFEWIGDKIGWLRDQIDRIPGINLGEDDVDASGAEDELDRVADTAGVKGQAAGEQWSDGYEQTAHAEPTVGTPDGDGELTGEITDELTDQFSDDEIQEIFEAREVEEGRRLHGITGESIERAADEGGTITPEMLGISDQQFNALLDDHGVAGSGGGQQGQSAPDADLLTGSRSTGGGSGLSVADLEEAFSGALQGLEGLELTMLLETDTGNRVIEEWFRDIAQAEIQEVVE